jgi:hypothetical protein
MAVALTREGQKARRQPWHPDYGACVGCGGTLRPHHSAGRCVDCVRGTPVVVALPPDVTGEKFCPKCERWKATRHFHQDRHRPDGLYSCCRQCRRPIQAAASRRCAAKKRAHTRRYRAEHLELLRAQDRARHRDNPEIAREKARLYRQRHRERVNAKKRAAYAANAEAERALARLRRERKKGTGR